MDTGYAIKRVGLLKPRLKKAESPGFKSQRIRHLTSKNAPLAIHSPLFFLQKEAFAKHGDGSVAAKNVTIAFRVFSRQQRTPCDTLDPSIDSHAAGFFKNCYHTPLPSTLLLNSPWDKEKIRPHEISQQKQQTSSNRNRSCHNIRFQSNHDLVAH